MRVNLPPRLGGARALGGRSIRPSQIRFVFLLDHLQRQEFRGKQLAPVSSSRKPTGGTRTILGRGKAEIPVKGYSALGDFHYETWDIQLARKVKLYLILRYLFRGHSE